MPDIIDQLNDQQAQQDRTDVAQAAHDLQWKNTFVDTPTPDVLRARVNLADTVNRAMDNKLALSARTDAKSLNLMRKTAEFDEWQKQAPLRAALTQARVDATGATERRKAIEAQTQAQHTANLNNGYVDLLQSGAKPGTDDYNIGMAKLVADNPHADPRHIQELSKHFSTPEQTPEEIVAKAVKLHNLAEANNLENTRVIPGAKGSLTIRQDNPKPTAQETTDAMIARNAAIAEAKRKNTPITPTEAGFVGHYAAPIKALTDASPILQKAGVDANAVWDATTTDNNLGTAIASGKITHDEAQQAAQAIQRFKNASGKKSDYQSHFDEVTAKMKALNPDAVPTAKPLDVDTAKKLIQEAGGDKDKARALAKERGYHF